MSESVQVRVQRVTYASSYRERQPCITCWMEWQEEELKRPCVVVDKAGPNNLK